MIYSLHVVQLELLKAWMMNALSRYLYFRETFCLVEVRQTDLLIIVLADVAMLNRNLHDEPAHVVEKVC